MKYKEEVVEYVLNLYKELKKWIKK
jgi:hypothetical protein